MNRVVLFTYVKTRMIGILMGLERISLLYAYRMQHTGGGKLTCFRNLACCFSYDW
ncbi:hypothetical protein AALP_AA6G164500 [Arabis alpina]|uniref:Uncharacterized protein n=1 Tax=Arabis alpina TaxID=50452 RepID=A0A087GPN2_ARAAL|nr:hypothetical protein AALP_AA6G164500 [Arabis alpina]